MRMLSDKSKKRFITLSVILVSSLYYLSSLGPPLYQELSTRLFYFPIFLGGLWFGFQGGVRVSLFVTLICLPHLIIGLWPDRSLLFDELLEILLFNLFGPIWGLLTDRERRQRALNQELETLAALGEAASSVAHEIKNVIIPIRGLLRKIREKQPLERKTTQYLDVVEAESARLEEMTQDMLHFAGHAPLRMEEVDVRALAEDVLQTLSEEFRKKGVVLSLRHEGDLTRVRLDPERMRQVLMNLLQNALHASFEGKEVRLRVSLDQAVLRIVVEDEGPGIPEGDLDRIFAAFFTTKTRGTGLGLAITKRIVEEHGGSIRVESVPEKGTRIRMRFPIDVISSRGNDTA